MSGFAPGARVRVRDDWPERRGPCHIRTPHYLRGRIGTVERALGRFPNPEDLAFARPAPERALYHVLFPQPPLFSEGRSGDEVLVELFEHWLEPADAAPGGTAQGGGASAGTAAAPAPSPTAAKLVQ